MAALLFLAAHPTVLTHSSPLYSSDFVGFAVDSMERAWTATRDTNVIVGFFNGAEGDVVPVRGARDIRDAISAGNRLVTDIRQVLESPAQPVVVDSIRARSAAIVPGVPFRSGDRAAMLPIDPTFGTAALGGAEDDRTILRQLGWEDGRLRPPTYEQGLKLPALDSDLLPIRLTKIFAPRDAFPGTVPVTFAELGPILFVAVPVEMSTAMGARLRRELSPHGALEIIGLANEYASYVATEDEYAAQDYMGASTIFGPAEGDALSVALQCLKQPLDADPGCAGLAHHAPLHVEGRRFRPGKIPDQSADAIAFGPSLVGAMLHAPDDGFAVLLQDSTGAPVRTLPYFEWTEEIVSDTIEFQATALRTVEVLQFQDGGWRRRGGDGTAPDDDRGANFLTVLRRGRASRQRDDGLRQWAALWLAPLREARSLRGTFKFRTTALGKGGVVQVRESCPFTLGPLPLGRTQARTNCPDE